MYRLKGSNLNNYQMLEHSTPLIDTSYDLTLRAPRTLLERFRSKSYDFNTQFSHVSRHFGIYRKRKKLSLEKTV